MFSVSKKENICICIETLCYIAYRDRFIASENVSNKKTEFPYIISLSNQKPFCILCLLRHGNRYERFSIGSL